MKKFLLPLIATFVVLLSPQEILAHPGRTAADGCHYCRTNCDSWGVPWNTRHCHGGTSAVFQPEVRVNPSPTIKPVVPISTLKPTQTAKAETGTTNELLKLGALAGLFGGFFLLLRKLGIK